MCAEWQELHDDVMQVRAVVSEQPYLLYAMGLRLRTMDYEALATDNLLDGPDDKKVDFFHLDFDSGVATIAQGYQSEDWHRQKPPANKASDLNAAVNWLLVSNLDDIPRLPVRQAAQELRDALLSGDITRVEFFYVHNLPSCRQVESELGTVKRGLDMVLERYGTTNAPWPQGLVQQVSRDVVLDWRLSLHETISIRDEVTLTSTIPPQHMESREWQAVVASVPATELVGLKARYGDALFSANVRDYLGSRESARNINRQIERTASEEPQNFWIFNNGVTILTHRIDVDDRVLRLSGAAIINGAQTTGSLAEVAHQADLASAQVLVRIIQCNSDGLIDSVIRYNNTQNPIRPWELRVVDPIQRRLSEEFRHIGITYQLRRSAARRAGGVSYDKLGPLLSAFYGDPIQAHKNKAALFDNENTYRQLFDHDTSVRNLLFIYRLGDAVAQTKAELRARVQASTATADEDAQFRYFRFGGFAFVVVYVCAEVLGVWLEEHDQNYRRRVTLRDAVLRDPHECNALLSKLAKQVVICMHAYLRDRDVYQDLKTEAGVHGIATASRMPVKLTHEMRADTYAEFTGNLVLVKPGH